MPLNPYAHPFFSIKAMVLYSPLHPQQQFQSYIFTPFGAFPNTICYLALPAVYFSSRVNKSAASSGSVRLTEINEELIEVEEGTLNDKDSKTEAKKCFCPTKFGKLGRIKCDVVRKWKAKESKFLDDDFFEFRKESGFHGSKTTVMIKNIPNMFDKKKILEILDDHCLKINKNLKASGECADDDISSFDFLYLPMDFRTRSNLGYAFVNFTSPIEAWRLYYEMHNQSWVDVGSPKICEVRFARIQGLKNLVGHFSRPVFFCRSIEYLPVNFSPSRNGFSSSTVCQKWIGKHVQSK